MKKCILCSKEHEGGCDKSEWDGVLQQRLGMTDIVTFNGQLVTFGEHSVEIDRMEDDALKADERQHLKKKRGRPSKK